MVRIRLTRKGAKKNPFYRIVAVDKEAPRDGAFLEILGTYDPKKTAIAEKVVLKDERVAHWLKVGAQPSDTVRSLISAHGFYKRQQAAASAS